jgi:hypothetical protein
MLLHYLKKTGVATLEVINCIYNMPDSRQISILRFVLAHEEVWFGHRLDGEMRHWHPEFMEQIIKVYKKGQSLSRRVMEEWFKDPTSVCEFAHRHTIKESSCSSLAKNKYFTATPPAQEPPKKKRKTKSSRQTVELLED